MTETHDLGGGGERHAGGWTEDADAPRPFLGPLLRDLKPYRPVIRGAVVLAALFVVVAGLALWIIFPTEKTASLEFHVDFDGVASGVYPNGAKFSSEDFLAEPVVRRVYEENEIVKYAKYEKFRISLFVTSVNTELEILEREYRARLADQKLQPVDRMKVEREFREKTAAMRTAAFKLTMVRKERLRGMDKALIEKILHGILEGWAEDAAKTRGALRYDLPIYSPAMLQKEVVETEDYLIGADLLRRKVNRVIQSLDQLLKVPGGQVFRLPGSGASLPEIRLRLEDVGAFRIAPILGLIRSTGLSKNPAATMRYIEERLLETTRLEKMALDQEGKIRDGLEAYMRTEKGLSSKSGGGGEGAAGGGREMASGAVIPQLGESFIDRLMDLAGTKGDAGFRKSLTERMITAGLENASLVAEVSYYKEMEAGFRKLQGGSGGDPNLRAATAREIQVRFPAVVAEMETSLNQIRELYEQISARNLRPASALFGVEKPMSLDSKNALSIPLFLVLGVLFIGFVGFVTAAVVVIQARSGDTRA